VPAQQSETRIQLAQADVATVETPVSYSSDQADRGEKNYTDNCEECHGDDLKGGLLGGAPLRGLSFEEKFTNGAPAGALFEYMSTTMPPNAPGRYSASTYADLMAYILKRNGFKAGAELPSDVEALYNLTMEK
jgi:mono/diheme cytochrome c family protein